MIAIHVGDLAVQMHRHDGAHAPPVARFTSSPSRVSHCVAMNFSMAAGEMLKVPGSMSTNTRPRADARDRAGGGEERVRRGDDLVARADVERHQRDQQRVGTGGHADAELAAGVFGDRGFERLHLGAEDEMLRFADAQQRGVEFGLE